MRGDQPRDARLPPALELATAVPLGHTAERDASAHDDTEVIAGGQRDEGGGRGDDHQRESVEAREAEHVLEALNTWDGVHGIIITG